MIYDYRTLRFMHQINDNVKKIEIITKGFDLTEDFKSNISQFINISCYEKEKIIQKVIISKQIHNGANTCIDDITYLAVQLIDGNIIKVNLGILDIYTALEIAIDRAYQLISRYDTHDKGVPIKNIHKKQISNLNYERSEKV